MLYYEKEDLVALKKGHPCGGNSWKILRTGVDMKLECQGCTHQIWMTRIDFEKSVRKILVGEKWIKIVHHTKENKEGNQ